VERVPDSSAEVADIVVRYSHRGLSLRSQVAPRPVVPANTTRSRRPRLFGSGRALERARTLGLSPDTTPTRITGRTVPPSHVSHPVQRAPIAGSDKPHQFPHTGLLGRRAPTTIRSTSPAAQEFSVTVGTPPEITRCDRPPQRGSSPPQYKHFCDEIGWGVHETR
jgi:hypothetical protein